MKRIKINQLKANSYSEPIMIDNRIYEKLPTTPLDSAKRLLFGKMIGFVGVIKVVQTQGGKYKASDNLGSEIT